MMAKFLAFVFVIVLFFAHTAYAATSAGMTGALLQEFTRLELQYALPNGILAKVAMVESGGNASAQAKCNRCTATGLFQFTKDTWLQQSAVLYGQPRALNERFNPFTSAEMAAFGLAQIRNRIGGLIQQNGVDMTVGLYMGHLLGEGGARTFFSNMIKNPHASVAPYFSATTIRNNSGILGCGSFAQVVNCAAAKLRTPGVFALSNYQNVPAGQTYAGAIPTYDPERDYQTDYSTWQSPYSSSPSPIQQPSTYQVGSLGNAYGTSAATSTAPYYPSIVVPFSTTTSFGASPPQNTSVKKTIPVIPAERIGQISVGAPSGTTTPTTTPLTHEEYERLYGQQTVVLRPQLPTTVAVTNNQPVVPNAAPYAGFSLAQGEEQTRVFMKIYIDILGKVARALGEILRMVRGESGFELNIGYGE